MAKSQDRKLVAAKQKYEAYYIAGRYKVPLAAVRAAMKKVGVSRAKIYRELVAQGFVVETAAVKKKLIKKK